MEAETTTEWRVCWRRESWKPSSRSNRRFTSRQGAEYYLAKLTGDARPDLSPLVDPRIEEREVGPWKRSR